TRIGIDVSAVPMRHIRTDDQNRYLEDIDSGLNNCLTVEANVDQAARAFRQDIAMTILDEGIAAIVPVDTTLSPEESGGYDIQTLRVGRIVSWMPKHVRVSLFNENRGLREEITLPKKMVAIVENPLYSVMNESNSTLQRLLRKLNLLDTVDEQSSSGKLDLIIQLPYVIKSEARRQQAEQRRQDIEFQLKGSQYGIAYTDGTEKIVQLNRAVDNNLLPQIQELKTQLYVELGLTPEIMNGTADEKIMLNYYARTIEPLLDAIVESMIRVFLTKTARTQGQSIMYFRDPFKFVPIGGEGGIADIADKFSRNEITSSNEIRQAIGMKPRPEPKADALINANMPQADTGVVIDSTAEEVDDTPDPVAAELTRGLADSEAEIDAALAGE
ncbi:MAG TPA: phage portal protein, partial [Candidatus Acidoferrum sp.]|nr:phage portal protein [Candidatus Acidoferrum sp.]